MGGFVVEQVLKRSVVLQGIVLINDTQVKDEAKTLIVYNVRLLGNSVSPESHRDEKGRSTVG